MQSSLFARAGIVVVIAAIASSPADAQIAELGKIISDKDKKAAEAVEKAGKQGKGKTTATPTTRTTKARPKPAPATSVMDPFSSDTEDPMNILDINSELLGRFTTGLKAEAGKRSEPGKPLTEVKYLDAGAEAAGMTPRQYFILKSRVAPYCEAAGKGLERPLDTKLGYWPAEMDAMRPRCAEITAALTKLS